MADEEVQIAATILDTEIEMQEKGEIKKDKTDKADPGLEWDYCLVLGQSAPPKSKEGFTLPKDDPKRKKWKEIEDKRRKLVALLRDPEVGLRVTRKWSSDKKDLFVLVTAEQDRLEAQAELISLKMKMKDEHGGSYISFEAEKKHLLQTEGGLFRKSEKYFLVETILIQALEAKESEKFDMDTLIKEGVITKYFPLHTEKERKELISTWANPKKAFKSQPINQVRDYFGEEISLYFAWLGFYTKWLWIASAVGVVAMIFWFIEKFSDGASWALWASSIYAIFLSFWGTFFLEYWKRKNNELNWKWGTMEYHAREVERSSYYGEPMLGTYSLGTWVALDPEEEYLFGKGSDLPKVKYYPEKVRRAKMAVSGPIVATMITVVIIATFSVLSFRLFMQGLGGGVASTLGGFAGGIANAITIIIMNVVWRMVATKLTEWENHRTQSEFDNQLISKVFLFYFVNSYTSLYYIAFVKSGFVFFGSDNPNLRDQCKWVISDGQLLDESEAPQDNISPGCVDELSVQILTILFVNMFIGQAREVMIPWLMGKIKLYLLVRGDEVSKADVSTYERDSKKQMFPGIFDEYSEMIIQYGYITLFAAAFPLAPLMAALNNAVEIRTDAFKLLTAHPRPNYRGAQSIGTWYKILEVVGIIAVITNCLLIGLSFSAISDLFDEGSVNRAFAALGIAIALEHFILIIKYIIAVLVPDVPSWMMKQLAKEEFIKEKTLNSFIPKTTAKQWITNNVVDSDEEAEFSDDEGQKVVPMADDDAKETSEEEV